MTTEELNFMILKDYLKLKGGFCMNIGIIEGKYVTIIDGKYVVSKDGLLCRVPPSIVVDTGYHLGEVAQIVASENPYHHNFLVNETVILCYVMASNRIMAYGTNFKNYQSICLEDIGYHVPSTEWLDLQGEPVHVGDTVMIFNTADDEVGKQVIVEKLDKDMWDDKKMMRSGRYHKYMENVLKLDHMLPPHVTMEILPEHPKTISVSLCNKEDTKIIKRAKATCSNSDTYSFEFGLYGVALPRLFDKPIHK